MGAGVLTLVTHSVHAQADDLLLASISLTCLTRCPFLIGNCSKSEINLSFQRQTVKPTASSRLQ